MKAGFGAGHGGEDPGAVSQGNVERELNRIMNAALIEVALSAGFEVVNLTVDLGYPYNINEPVAIANANGVVYAFQSHFNAGGGNGSEVLHHSSDGAAGALAARLSAAIAGTYGLTNRGAKGSSSLGFINYTNMQAFIIEWGFVDAPGNCDVPVILSNVGAGAAAVINVLGGNVDIGNVPSGGYTPPVVNIPDSGSDFDGGTYICNVGTLNIRSSPSTGGYPVGEYTRGETVVLDSWYTVADGYVWGRYTAYSGAIRYIAVGPYTGTADEGDFLVKAGGGSSTPSQTVSSGIPARVYTVAVPNLNVRDAPSPKATWVAEYYQGETVTLDGWATIAEGYIWGRYVAYSGATRYIAVGPSDGSELYLV